MYHNFSTNSSDDGHLGCFQYPGGGLVTKSCPALCDPMDCSLPAPLSMGFSRQEYCHFLLQARILPFPSPGDLLNTGIEPRSPALQADSFYQLSYKRSSVLAIVNTAVSIYIPSNSGRGFPFLHTVWSIYL